MKKSAVDYGPTMEVSNIFSCEREQGTQRQGRRAMLRDILQCPFGLGPEIDIFQSDERLM